MVISYKSFGTTYPSLLQKPMPQYRVYKGQSVGSDKFSVVWCQPIGLMQVVGREGGEVVSAALKTDVL
jgi:hypothetical protein